MANSVALDQPHCRHDPPADVVACGRRFVFVPAAAGIAHDSRSRCGQAVCGINERGGVSRVRGRFDWVGNPCDCEGPRRWQSADRIRDPGNGGHHPYGRAFAVSFTVDAAVEVRRFEEEVARPAFDVVRASLLPAPVEGSVSGARDSRAPAIQRAYAASNGSNWDIPHAPAAFHSGTMFTPVVRPDLLLRTAVPAMFRSSRSEAGAPGASGIAVSTGRGAHDLALMIIGRKAPGAVDTSEVGPASSPGLVQRSQTASGLAPVVNNLGAPVSATPITWLSPLGREASWPNPHDAAGRAAKNGLRYVSGSRPRTDRLCPAGRTKRWFRRSTTYHRR